MSKTLNVSLSLYSLNSSAALVKKPTDTLKCTRKIYCRYFQGPISWLHQFQHLVLLLANMKKASGEKRVWSLGLICKSNLTYFQNPGVRIAMRYLLHHARQERIVPCKPKIFLVPVVKHVI